MFESLKKVIDEKNELLQKAIKLKEEQANKFKN